MENRKVLRYLMPLLIILAAVLIRIFPHPANVAPITAMALFGGCYLNKKYALVLPLTALFLSDIFLGFYSAMPFVYGSFLMSGLLGLWLQKHKSVRNTVLITFFSSLQFFLITNLGVWLRSSLYPHTVSGFFECYYMAIPFFKNTLMGDFLYTGILFGGYALLKQGEIAFRLKKIV